MDRDPRWVRFCVWGDRPGTLRYATVKGHVGLVQAPRAFYETFRKILTSADNGMLQSKVDPCLFYKQDGSGRLTALMVIHVDDCAIAGKKSTVEEIKKAIAKRLSIKDEEGGCQSIWVSGMSGMRMVV